MTEATVTFEDWVDIDAAIALLHREGISPVQHYQLEDAFNRMEGVIEAGREPTWDPLPSWFLVYVMRVRETA